jgi:hypothetical protein
MKSFFTSIWYRFQPLFMATDNKIHMIFIFSTRAKVFGSQYRTFLYNPCLLILSCSVQRYSRYYILFCKPIYTLRVFFLEVIGQFPMFYFFSRAFNSSSIALFQTLCCLASSNVFGSFISSMVLRNALWHFDTLLYKI